MPSKPDLTPQQQRFNRRWSLRCRVLKQHDKAFIRTSDDWPAPGSWLHAYCRRCGVDLCHQTPTIEVIA